MGGFREGYEFFSNIAGAELAAVENEQWIDGWVEDVEKELKSEQEKNSRLVDAKEGEAVDTEGCLSVPDIYGEVKRAAKVKVEFMNRRGKRQHLTATGLLARCIQHELDHLEGQLFIDIATSVHRGNQS